jgi:hypothetical protein
MTYEDCFTSRMIISLLSRRALELNHPELVEDPLGLTFFDSLLLASNRAQVAPRVESHRESLWTLLTKVLPSRTSMTYEYAAVWGPLKVDLKLRRPDLFFSYFSFSFCPSLVVEMLFFRFAATLCPCS